MTYLLISLLLLIPLSVSSNQPIYDVGLNFAHEDNIARAELSEDIFSDNRINYFGSVGYLHQLNSNSGLLFKGGIEWSDYNKYDKLDNLNINAEMIYKYKPDLHYTSPWYSLGLKVSESIYNTSELRDNYAFTAEAMAGKRITDKVMLRTGIAYRTQNARTDQLGLLGGKLYDIDYGKAFVGGDYLHRNFVFYGQYTYQTGDVVSNAGTPTRKILLVAKEVQQDDALGLDRVNPDDPDDTYGIYGYRLDANTHILDFGINYALGRASALDFNIQLIDVHGNGDNNYKNYIANVGFFYRFK